jgi:lysozyme family protein
LSPTNGPDPLFDAIFNEVVLGIEGGDKYSDHPSDAGGKTRFGVTEKLARKHGYTGPMHLLPMVVAKDIYIAEWWKPMHLAEVGAIAGHRIAKEMFEQAINLPWGQPTEHMQRALNSFNKRGKDYPDLLIDRGLGPATLNALRSFMTIRKGEGAAVLFKALNAQQGTYYLARGEVRPENEDFTFGWFSHRVF